MQRHAQTGEFLLDDGSPLANSSAVTSGVLALDVDERSRKQQRNCFAVKWQGEEGRFKGSAALCDADTTYGVLCQVFFFMILGVVVYYPSISRMRAFTEMLTLQWMQKKKRHECVLYLYCVISSLTFLYMTFFLYRELLRNP